MIRIFQAFAALVVLSLTGQPGLAEDHLGGQLMKPSDVPDLTVIANIGGVTGFHDLTGRFLRRAEQRQSGTEIIVPERSSVFRLERNGIIQFDVSAGKKRHLQTSDTESGIPRLIAHVPHRKSLLCIWKNGHGNSSIQEYSLADHKWRDPVSLDGVTLTSFEFNEGDGSLVVSFIEASSRKSGIGVVTADGNFVILDIFSGEDLPGFMDMADGENGWPGWLEVLAVKGDWIALGAFPRGSQRFGAPEEAPVSRIYLYNAETRRVGLTYFGSTSTKENGASVLEVEEF